MKALIDQSQVLWARKYVHRLSDSGKKWRSDFLLSLGATKGKNLFEGVDLTAKYFFDAVGAHFEGSLTYRQIERPGEIKQHPTALTDAKEKARKLVKPFLKRKRILFVMHAAARWQAPLHSIMPETGLKPKARVLGVQDQDPA